MNNVQKGEQFKLLVAKVLSKHIGSDYQFEVPFNIGGSFQQHRMDIIFEKENIAVECKCYSYTASGNNPSAKISTFVEAVNYMNQLPPDYKKVIALKRATHPTKRESLAAYIYRTKKPMLGDVQVIEIDDAGQGVYDIKFLNVNKAVRIELKE